MIGLLLAFVGVTQACDPGSIGGVMDHANTLLSEDNAGEARRVLEQAYNHLPERCDPVAPTQLGRLLFVSGALAMEAGDAAAADLWFGLHLTQVPGLPPPAGMAESALVAYGRRRVEIEAQGVGEFVASEALFVDGVIVRAGEVIVVPAGVHLVQPPVGVSWVGTWFTAEPGVRIRLRSGEIVPGETVPGETVPGETAPGETVPGAIVPSDTPQPAARRGALVIGAGLATAAIGGGALLGLALPGSTWATQCRTGLANGGEPLPSTVEGLRSCGARTGRPVLAAEISALSLVSLGAALSLSGGVVWVVGPSASSLTARF